MNLFQGMPLRGKPRVYGGHVMPGHAALVTEVRETYCQVIVHNMYRIEVVEIMHEDIPKIFFPDFEVPGPREAAQGFQQISCMMVVVPPASELINTAIKTAVWPDMAQFKKSFVKGGDKVAESFVACADYNRRTCIMVGRTEDMVKVIPLRSGDGLNLEEMTAEEFDERYKPIANYPSDKAVLLYKEYAIVLGASPEALDCLSQVILFTKQEYDMATAKKASAEKAKIEPVNTLTPKKKPLAKKTAAVKTSKPVKVVKETKSTSKAGQVGEKKPSAAQMFQELIMEGGMTDDQIFAKVQKKFGLEDKKRSYVSWYRNYLVKQGKNPPVAAE